MEALSRYSVAEYQGVHMVVVESELLPPDPAVVVVPLLPNYPAVKDLNPAIVFNGQRLILATRLISAVRRASVRPVGHVADQADAIRRAIDVLISGV